MADTNYKEVIKLFKNKIAKNAPLANSLKYPYKPFLVIAIFSNLEINELFNNKISILENTKILKTV